MEPYTVTEFEARVDNKGNITLPASLMKVFPVGTFVTVRLIEGTLSSSLRARRVTEDEIESIAKLQMEPRENVIRCLQAEGALVRKSAFQRRAIALEHE